MTHLSIKRQPSPFTQTGNSSSVQSWIKWPSAMSTIYLGTNRFHLEKLTQSGIVRTGSLPGIACNTRSAGIIQGAYTHNNRIPWETISN